MSLQTDIDRGLEIVVEIEALKTELSALTERVKRAALNGPQIPLEDADRDGTQFIARGTEKLVPVVITADYLAASFTNLSPKHEEVLAALPHRQPQLTDFYQPKTTWERGIDDGKDFRRLAREMLAECAEPFIVACLARDRHGIPKNAVKIGWDRAREGRAL